MAERTVIAFDVGIKNLAYCIMHLHTDGTRSIKALELVDLGCRKGDTQRIIDRVIDMLDDVLFVLDIESMPLVVLIESQMTSVMKCIQTAINTFFKVTAKYTNADITTQYMSARHKLSLVKQFEDFETARTKTTTKYKANKLDSVEFALWHLKEKEQNAEYHDRVLSFKKRDDVCDAYLMTLYYAELP